MIEDSPTDVEAVMLLCDSAQSVGGKLYILGGGWTQTSNAAFPGGLVMGLAVKVWVPWDRANERIPIRLRLVNDEGEPTSFPDGQTIEAVTELEVGRPTGLKRGTPLDAALAVNFTGLQLSEGGYAWVLDIAGSIKSRVAFRVLP